MGRLVGTKEVKTLQEEFHISKVSRYNRLLAAHLHLSNPLTSPLLNPSSYFPEIRRTKSGSFVILIFLLDFSNNGVQKFEGTNLTCCLLAC